MRDKTMNELLPKPAELLLMAIKAHPLCAGWSDNSQMSFGAEMLEALLNDNDGTGAAFLDEVYDRKRLHAEINRLRAELMKAQQPSSGGRCCE
jgi:hypothetical protein